MKDGGWIVIETNDETALYLQPGALELFDAFHQVAAFILSLAAFGQAAFIGRFDPDEHRVKSGARHQAEQLWIIDQVDRDFRAEWQSSLALAPLDQGWQNLSLDLLLVADKVIINEKYAFMPA